MGPFAEYPEQMAKAEIGSGPLDGIVFNEGKSLLKASEYAALGVPVVMSPTPDNVRLRVIGVGMLASTRNHWVKKLNALDPEPGPPRGEMTPAGDWP